MKLNTFLAAVLIIVLIGAPLSARADFIPGDPVLSTFENQQGYVVELSIDGVPLIDTGTTTVASEIDISYEITLGTRFYPSQTDEERAEMLLSILEDNPAYLELWRGVPFSTDATFIESRELPSAPSGNVSMSVPGGGAHFFILYSGDEIRDLAAYCAKYQVASENCYPGFVEQHAPAEVHPYFTYALDSNEWTEFQFAPIWGGVRFTVDAPTTGVSNVLFLPGFLSSRLYTKEGTQEELLWEPLGSGDVRKLTMNADGTSPRTVYTRNIIGSLLNIPYGFTIYGKFMEYLDGLKEEEEIADWKGYPYDWRYDVFDVVEKGALKEDGSREYLVAEVERLAQSSKSGKVTVIGHSNGGLLAKALMLKLAEVGKESLVDKVILIATPEAGTPKGLFSLLHGREIDLQFWIPPTVRREVAATFPGAYALIPSSAYYAEGETPLATFAAGSKTDTYVQAYGGSIEGAAEAESFMLNDPVTRSAPAAGDTGTPLPLNAGLVAKAKATHQRLDAWSPPTGVEVHEIVGWGQPTMSGADYITKQSSCFAVSCFSYVDYTPRLSYDGDDTVMGSSASFQGVETYFNLFELSNLENGDDENRKHKDITESPFLHSYIGKLLGVEQNYNEILFSEVKPIRATGRVMVGIHSPAIIKAEDVSGNSTGIFTYSDQANDLMYVREDIPGSKIELGAEAKYLVLPSNQSYDFTINGTGSGTFGLTFTDEEGTVFKEFKNLPVSTSTEATVSLTDTAVGQLSLDIDGDGTVDAKVTDTLTRKDAVGICKKEIGRIQTLFVRLYLAQVLGNIELQGQDNTKLQKFVSEIRAYVQTHLSSIPPERAAAIATCVRALENSKK